MMPATTLEVLAAKDAIREQIYRYCRSIDRMDREMIRQVWHVDGTIDFTDGLVDNDYPPGPPPVPFERHFDHAWKFRATLSGHSHQATNIMIAIDDDRAGSETTSITVLQRIDGEEVRQMMFWGRWLDRWSRRDGHWAIDHRIGVTDCMETHTFPLADRRPPTRSRRDREDLSYAILDLSVPLSAIPGGSR